MDKNKLFEEIYQKYDGKYGDLVGKYVDLRIAYDILMEYWDSLPDEQKPEIDERFKGEMYAD